LTDVNYIILYNKDQAMVKKISSAQMRAARALLRWSALDLATASKVGVATIRRVEVVDGEIPVTLANEAALRRALETAGVEFIDENGGGPGVRLRRPPQGKQRK
jgi:hypothetical protein